METRVAVISLIVTQPEAVEELNAILHTYSSYIIGRMGLPYRQKNVNIICVAVDAPQDIISAMSGKLGLLAGVNANCLFQRNCQGIKLLGTNYLTGKILLTCKEETKCIMQNQ